MILPSYTHKRLLIDCNSYFASCEQLRSPSLRWIPLCVWRSSIVLAASYEAKAYWVRTWTPVREAKKMLPSTAVFVDADMRRYWIVSSKLMSWLQALFPHVYVASIDEAFVDVSDLPTYRTERVLTDLQQRILNQVWLPVSIGWWPTKMLAKIAAERKKPLWVTTARSRDTVTSLLAQITIRDVPYLWRQSCEKIRYLCQTWLQFAQLEHSQVEYHLGHMGIKIRYELNGYSMSIKAMKGSQPKSIGRVRSFSPHFTRNKVKLRWYLQQNITRARRELKDYSLWVQRISVHLKSQSFRTYWSTRQLPHPVSTYNEIVSICKEIFTAHFSPQISRRRTGVSFSMLHSTQTQQHTLFESHEKQQATWKLDEILHSLNTTYWPWTIHQWAYSSSVKKQLPSRDMLDGVS